MVEVVQGREPKPGEHVYTLAAQTDTAGSLYLTVPVVPGWPGKRCARRLSRFRAIAAADPADARGRPREVQDPALATVVRRALRNYLAASPGELAADLTARCARVAPRAGAELGIGAAPGLVAGWERGVGGGASAGRTRRTVHAQPTNWTWPESRVAGRYPLCRWIPMRESTAPYEPTTRQEHSPRPKESPINLFNSPLPVDGRPPIDSRAEWRERARASSWCSRARA